MHSRWRQVLFMSLQLDSRPLHGREQGGSRERLPQVKLTCTKGRSLREKQKIREEEEEEEGTKTELWIRSSMSSKRVANQMSIGRSV